MGRMEGEEEAGGGGGGPVVILDGAVAASVAVRRKFPHSVYAYLSDRFYEYVESNGDRIALTKGGREVAEAFAEAYTGRRSKKRPAILGELARMRDAPGGAGGGAWQGRIDAVYRAAIDDPQSKAAERWLELLAGVLPKSVYEKYPDGEAAEAAAFKWMYSHAEDARQVAAEAAGAAERTGGAGADLVTISSHLLAFAGEIKEATGGRLRILDAQRVCREITAGERAELAGRLRGIVPRRGERLTMEELRKRFGLLMLGRIGRSVRNHVIIIVRERGDKRTYEKDGLVMCAGEGRYVQRMVKINRAIRDSGPEGYPILLFERVAGGGGDVVFKACLRYRSHSTLTDDSMDNPAPDETILFELEPADCAQWTGAED